MNKLFYGDCMEVMKDLGSDSIDLIYLDPPFNSNRAYHTIYKDSTGNPLPEQVEAFCDIWELTAERLEAIKRLPELMVDNGVDTAVWEFWRAWMNALRHTQPRLLAYLSYMTERLIVMRRLLKNSGSIYIHCDPTASHYIKIIMDGVFGHKNFQNEIVWCYPPGGRPPRGAFHRKHDTLLYYSKSAHAVFNQQYKQLTEKQIAKFSKTDADGRKYKEYRGKTKTYLDDVAGSPVPDWWTDIHSLGQAISKERLGYPTQKPLSLLRRIISASSKEGDIVLDPFCGCATTIAAAHELNRNWIGVDIAFHAICRVVQMRLADQYNLNEGVEYEVAGIPNTLEAADDLWRRDPYQFQRWAVEMVGGFVTNKQSADGGIDGKIYFQPTANSSEFESMILEVKGGEHVGIETVRSLRGAMERQGAAMAGLILKKEPGRIQKRNFLNEMFGEGDLYQDKFPRMQMLTIAQILNGEKFLTPHAFASGERQTRIPFRRK